MLAACFVDVDLDVQIRAPRAAPAATAGTEPERVTADEHEVDPVHRQLRQDLHLERLGKGEREQHEVIGARRLYVAPRVTTATAV